jgi:hypothetical protein
MMASPTGMMLAASMNPPSTWGTPGGEQDEGNDPGGDVTHALDGKVGIGAFAGWPDGDPEVGGGRSGRKEKSCAYEDDA